MKVTILRHGEAGDAASDRKRQLTVRGNDDIRNASESFAQACRQLQIGTPHLIAHSPWLRTQQTADIMAAGLPLAERKELESLRSESSVSGVEKCLDALHQADNEDQHILLVSHQPLVSSVVQYFLGQQNPVPALSPGSLVSFELAAVSRQSGELLFWAVPPLYEINR